MLDPSGRTLACFVLTVIFVMAMAEPGTPKSARQDSIPPREGAGRLVSPPAGARAIPARNPKAPLPPRVSLPDAREAAGGVIEPIRPIVIEAEPPRSTTAAPSRSSGSVPPRPPAFGRSDAKPSAPPPPLPPAAVDPALALAQLQRQRENGAPAPPAPASRPALGGAPETQRFGGDARFPNMPPGMMNAPSVEALPPPPIQPFAPAPNTPPVGVLNLKPGTASLAAGRTPAPNAIVGGSSLRINAGPERPMPSRPSTHDGFVPPALATGAYPAPPPTMQGVAPAAVPPVASSSRPSTAAKPFSPPVGGPPAAGGPPASYERAFRQWSSPSITTAEDSAGGPVTFQVYTARDISTGRGPMRSIPPPAPAPKKASLGLRIAMAVGGGLVVLLTAAAVIAVSTEEPKRPMPSANAEPTVEVAPVATSEPAPVPSTISIGDPLDDDAPTTPVTTPAPAPVVAKAKPKVTATATATTTSAPSGLKAIAPPPNPYGNK